jgi:hypothetical protein
MTKRKLIYALAAVVILFVAVGFFYPTKSVNRIPSAALRALTTDPKPVIFSLNPECVVYNNDGTMTPLPESTPKFCGYEILGQSVVESRTDRARAVETIVNGIQNWNGRIAACFEPRHGIRVSGEGGTYDFLICFACSRVILQLPDGTITSIAISASGTPLNEILSAANVRLPAAP